MQEFSKTQLLEQLLNILTKQNDLSENKVVDYKSPEELKELLNLTIDEEGEGYQGVFSDIENYLKYSVKTKHKQFLNQLYSGENLPAVMGEIVTAFTNTSMYTYEVAPAATLIEKELIDKMCRIAGYKNGGGTFATGGSNANMLAMMSARNKMLPTVKNTGMQNTKVLTAFVSEQSHYSFDTAANILGIGGNNVYKIATDENGKMNIDDLEHKIILSLKKGEAPFFIGATAGTTMLGAFDPFEEIAVIAKKFGVWMHVDGSFGGSVILSKRYKHLFKGIEKSDSFTWNPHKLMNVPLIASVFLVCDKTRLLKNLTDLNTDYIYHNNDISNYNLGKQSVQCGRRVDALKVWLAWKFFGDKGYEDRINKMFDLAEYAKQKVQAHEKLELLAERQSLTVCFRFKSVIHNANELNLSVRESLMKQGLSLVNYGYLNNEVAIRLVISNADIDEKDLDEFFNNYINEAVKFEKAFTNKGIAA
ncbi:MAG: glutamate decarboxylase [Chloroflexia bacterium]|nr:glutamate decarboxylase [Chloroflexia bacterium]